MKKALPLIGLVLAACTAAPSIENTAEPENTSSSSAMEEHMEGVTASTVNYGPTEGYLAIPEGEGPFPAIILIHEWWGLNDNIRWYAEKYASEGYVALAVDLYDGESTDDPAVAGQLAGSVRENLEPAFANLESAVEYLSALPEVDSGRLASLGWCFGGGWSYQMAATNMGTKVSVMYYGQFAPDDDLEMMKAQILGHFGEDDQSIPVDDVRTFEAKLGSLDGDHRIYIYPNSGHGFARNLDNPEAKQAWDRTLEYLEEHL